MSEIYKLTQDVKNTLATYKRIGKDFGYAIVHEGKIITFYKKITTGRTEEEQSRNMDRIVNYFTKKGYTYLPKESEQTIKILKNESIGLGFRLAINKEEIDINLDTTQKINKTLNEILIETRIV